MLVTRRRGLAFNAKHGVRLAQWRKYGARLFEDKSLAQVIRSREAVPFYSAVGSVDIARRRCASPLLGTDIGKWILVQQYLQIVVYQSASPLSC